MQTPNGLLQIINEAERLFPVNLWEMNDIDVWPLLRTKIRFEVLEGNVESVARNNNSQEQGYEGIFPATSLFENDEPIDVFILFDSFLRIKLMDEKTIHRISGFFNEQLRGKSLTVANLEYSEHGFKTVRPIDESYLIQPEYEYFIGNRNSYSTTELEKFHEVKDFFYQKLGCHLYCLNLDQINYETARISRMSDFFKELFIIKKTKIIFIINYYNELGAAAIAAAKELNIVSVDIQHGNYSPIQYFGWSNIPENGYNTLPSYFWSWNRQNTEEINKSFFPLTHHQAVAGGNAWLEMWMDQNSSIVKYYERKLIEYTTPTQKNILITLQPMYGLGGWDKNIPDWLLQTIADSSDEYKWFIRYHHQMLGKFIQEYEQCETLLSDFIKIGKVETIISTNEPLMAVLKNMDVHITAFSTSVIDAQYVCVPSVTLYRNAETYFENEIRDHWVVEAFDKQSTIEAIQLQISRKKAGYFNHFKPSSIGISRALDVIIEKTKMIEFISQARNKSIEKECYLSEGRYECITSNENYISEPNEAYIVGKAFEHLKNIDKANKYYCSYIESFGNDKNYNNVSITKLFNIFNFLRNNSFDNQMMKVEKEILDIICNSKSKQSQFFKYLFDHKWYSDIILLFGKVPDQLDVLYFTGRSYLVLNKLDEGIDALNEFLKEFEKEKHKGRFLTSGKNYELSANFYLGEAYLELNNHQESIKYFSRCDKLSNGTHKKALQYLLKF